MFFYLEIKIILVLPTDLIIPRDSEKDPYITTPHQVDILLNTYTHTGHV